MKVVIDFEQRYQQIRSFSASDAWYADHVGKYWPESEKHSIAKLLFSQEIIDQQPQGIGLSGWRFNLGGGTAEQGDASDIPIIERRAESFLNPMSHNFDWSKQAGQQYFLQQAVAYGVQELILFSNTPHVDWTYNGKGYSSRGSFSNLRNDKYPDFAQYLVDVLTHFNQTGISFTYLSPINEPQHNWDQPTQEGSAWQNSEIYRLATLLDQAMTDASLPTKIMLPEAASWRYFYEKNNQDGRSDLINQLYAPDSLYYLGNLKNVAPVIAGHSYWTDANWTMMQEVRKTIYQSVQPYQLKIYQSEWSMLGDDYSWDEFEGFKHASYMDIALYMAKVIHSDLVDAQVNSWSFWTAMAPEQWGHKNRFLLVNLLPQGGADAPIANGGTHIAQKTLWVLGNYSLFIRPNYQRVDVAVEEQEKNSILVSGYLSPDNKTFVLVAINLSTQEDQLEVHIPSSKKIVSIKSYTTNEHLDLKEKILSTSSKFLTIEPRAVTSYIYHLK